MNLKRLGLLMSHWHSSQNDPIYAVGSYFVDDEQYPNIEVVERALSGFEEIITNKSACKYYPEDTLELDEIIESLKEYLDNAKGKLPNLSTAIQTGITHAFWNYAWANWAEEQGVLPSGCQIENEAPSMPPFVSNVALRFCCALEVINQKSIEDLYQEARKADGLDNSINVNYADLFGHYLAMQGMEAGVTWFDSHEKFSLVVPKITVEVSSTEDDDFEKSSSCQLHFDYYM